MSSIPETIRANHAGSVSGSWLQSNSSLYVMSLPPLQIGVNEDLTKESAGEEQLSAESHDNGAAGDGGSTFVPDMMAADASGNTSGFSVLSAPVEDVFATDPVPFAQDDIYFAHEDQVDFNFRWFRLGALKDGTDLLANDGAGAEIVAINGQPFEKGSPFDGDNGGEFRVHIGGVVDFRNDKSWFNPGETIEEGETTGFTYTVVDNEGNQYTARAEVTLKSGVAVDDTFVLEASELIAAGKSYLRLAAKNDHTDLLENDFGADQIELVNGAPIEEGVWFAGNNGGEFRVFAGGVLDFRNQGAQVAPGDATGFSYTARNANGLLNVADVLLEIDQFQFAVVEFPIFDPYVPTPPRLIDLDPYVGYDPYVGVEIGPISVFDRYVPVPAIAPGVEVLPPSVFNPYIPGPVIDPVDSFDLL